MLLRLLGMLTAGLGSYGQLQGLAPQPAPASGLAALQVPLSLFHFKLCDGNWERMMRGCI